MRVVDLDRDMSDVIPTGVTPDSTFLFERMTQLTLDTLAPRPGQRILDAAAGLGQDSRALLERGARAVCAEPSRRMVALGRQIEREQDRAATWVHAWSERLPFADDSFDAAFCKGALDHFDDPSGCIAELARIVRPGGRVVLAVASFDSLSCALQRALARLERAPRPGRRSWHVPSDHFTRYDPELLREQVGAHLRIESWTGVSLLWGVSPWIRLLGRLPGPAARSLLRGADRVARRLPDLADVIVVGARA